MGLTNDMDQIKCAVELSRKYSEWISGFKFFTCKMKNLSITEAADQYNAFHTLAEEGYKGIVVPHCEKQTELLNIFRSDEPISHCYARPEIAEIKAVKEILTLSRQAGYMGKLHIPHVSSPTAVDVINEAQKQGIDVSCATTPHHVIYDWNQMNAENGILWKMNPPLRSPKSRAMLLQYLKEGKIGSAESDHAPHTLAEKQCDPYMSGIPISAWWPLFVDFLLREGFSQKQIDDLTFYNAAKRFDINVERKVRPVYDRRSEYPFDPFPSLGKDYKWGV
jgi:dihydroorotase